MSRGAVFESDHRRGLPVVQGSATGASSSLFEILLRVECGSSAAVGTFLLSFITLTHPVDKKWGW
jgi:hypothetical protein